MVRGMTKILVTGGAGYVGSVSAEAFLAAGHDVVVLDDLTTGHRAAVPQGARLHVGSYGDGATVARLLTAEGIEAILHCAARSLVSESIADPARYFRDNVAGGITLLEAAREAGVDRVVFSSTAAVYGVPDATPIREDAPLRPINPYGETKRSFEGALAWYGRAYGMRSVTLRYFNVAGATDLLGEDHDPETHLIPTILRCVEANGRSPSSAPTTRPPTAPASATTSTCRTWPTRTCGRSMRRRATIRARPRRGDLQPRQRRRLQHPRGPGRRGARDRTGIPHEVGQRRPGDPPVLVASADSSRRDPWLAPTPPLDRRHGRLGLGLAPGPPGWLRRLSRLLGWRLRFDDLESRHGKGKSAGGRWRGRLVNSRSRDSPRRLGGRRSP